MFERLKLTLGHGSNDSFANLPGARRGVILAIAVLFVAGMVLVGSWWWRVVLFVAMLALAVGASRLTAANGQQD